MYITLERLQNVFSSPCECHPSGSLPFKRNLRTWPLTVPEIPWHNIPGKNYADTHATDVQQTSESIYLLACNTVGEDGLSKNKPSLPVSSFPLRASHRSPSGSPSAAVSRLRPHRACALPPPFQEQHNRCIQQTVPSGTRSLSEVPAKPPCDGRDCDSVTRKLLKKKVILSFSRFSWPVGAARTCPHTMLRDPRGLRAPAGRSLSDAVPTGPYVAFAWFTDRFKVIISSNTL